MWLSSRGGSWFGVAVVGAVSFAAMWSPVGYSKHRHPRLRRDLPCGGRVAISGRSMPPDPVTPRIVPATGGVSHAGPGDHNSLAGATKKVTGACPCPVYRRRRTKPARRGWRPGVVHIRASLWIKPAAGRGLRPPAPAPRPVHLQRLAAGHHVLARHPHVGHRTVAAAPDEVRQQVLVGTSRPAANAGTVDVDVHQVRPAPRSSAPMSSRPSASAPPRVASWSTAAAGTTVESTVDRRANIAASRSVLPQVQVVVAGRPVRADADRDARRAQVGRAARCPKPASRSSPGSAPRRRPRSRTPGCPCPTGAPRAPRAPGPAACPPTPAAAAPNRRLLPLRGVLRQPPRPRGSAPARPAPAPTPPSRSALRARACTPSAGRNPAPPARPGRSAGRRRRSSARSSASSARQSQPGSSITARRDQHACRPTSARRRPAARLRSTSRRWSSRRGGASPPSPAACPCARPLASSSPRQAR